MTKTILQGAADLSRMGSLLPKAVRDALKDAGNASKRIADVTGGRMRNLGKGVNLTARVKLGTTQAFVDPRPMGAWVIAESGAAPHLIGAKKLGTRSKLNKRVGGAIVIAALTGGATKATIGKFRRGGSVRGSKALTIPGVERPRAYARHPGARGRRRWTITVNEAERVVPTIFKRAVVAGSLRKVFG